MPSDPFAFILPINGYHSIWTWVSFSKVIGKISCNTSSDVLLNIFNKMYSDLAHFDVSNKTQ